VEINSSKLELSETAIKAKKTACSDKLISTYYFTRKPPSGGQNKTARLSAPKSLFPPQKNRWVLLRKTVASQTKTDVSRPNLPKNLNLARLYRDVRTEFEENP